MDLDWGSIKTGIAEPFLANDFSLGLSLRFHLGCVLLNVDSTANKIGSATRIVRQAAQMMGRAHFRYGGWCSDFLVAGDAQLRL